jgi:hypothetical protein
MFRENALNSGDADVGNSRYTITKRARRDHGLLGNR